MPLDEIKLSVALLTRNSSENLERALLCLHNQTLQPFEIVVSDDSDDPNSVERNRTLAKQYGAKYLSGPQIGLYGNRNHAAQACNGTHVRTMDDDHTFSNDHIEKCVMAVTNDPRAIWTTGELGYINGEYYSNSPYASQLHQSGQSHIPVNKNDNWAIADGSTIYPSEIFKTGHKYVDKYGYGPSYLEFGIYLYRLGYISKCIPNCKINHWADRSTLDRADDHSLEHYLSIANAVIAYNLYFNRSIIYLTKYLLILFLKCESRIGFASRLSSVFRDVKNRWNSPKGENPSIQ